jgi:hypothetical protein
MSVIVVSEVDTLERNCVERLSLGATRARFMHDRELGVAVSVAFDRRSVEYGVGCESRAEPKGILGTLRGIQMVRFSTKINAGDALPQIRCHLPRLRSCQRFSASPAYEKVQYQHKAEINFVVRVQGM